jgi:hypothetical protein
VPIPNEIWAFSAIILIGAFFVSPGFFTIDETIYYLGARSIAEHGTLGIDNGYAQFHSESLKLTLLVEGPQGLTPQYPAGSAVLAGLLLPFLGARAFILLNALAAVLTLFTVRNICLSQFKSEPVARIAVALLVAGTFWLEYTVGIWPHALAAYFALQAYSFALRHLDRDGEDPQCAILSGVFAGAGMLFRLDAIFAIVAIGLILILFAPRLVRSTFWFGAGALPAFALASWFNYLKFGSANPLSYGTSGGSTDLASYGPLIAALSLGLVALALFKKIGSRINRKASIASIAILGIAILLTPAASDWVVRCWRGFLALVIDARYIDDQASVLTEGPGQVMLVRGLVKKSLGQSMPWIGLAAILVTGKVAKRDRRMFLTLAILIATMTLPFISRSWHGGLSNNMRYFLPALPPICILCARLIPNLWSSVGKAPLFAVAGLWATIIVSLLWARFTAAGYAGVQHVASTFVLLATTLAALAAGASWRFQPAGRTMTITLLGSGFILSMMSAVSDFAVETTRRTIFHGRAATLSELPPKSLIITYPEWLDTRTPGNGSIVSLRDPTTKQIDRKLIVDALDAGYRVFIISYEFDVARDVPPGVQLFQTPYAYPDGQFLELRRMAISQPNTQGNGGDIR